MVRLTRQARRGGRGTARFHGPWRLLALAAVTLALTVSGAVSPAHAAVPPRDLVNAVSSTFVKNGTSYKGICQGRVMQYGDGSSSEKRFDIQTGDNSYGRLTAGATLECTSNVRILSATFRITMTKDGGDSYTYTQSNPSRYTTGTGRPGARFESTWRSFNCKPRKSYNFYTQTKITYVLQHVGTGVTSRTVILGGLVGTRQFKGGLFSACRVP